MGSDNIVAYNVEMKQRVLDENVRVVTKFEDMGMNLEASMEGVKGGTSLEGVNESVVVVRFWVLDHLVVEQNGIGWG